MIAENTCLVIFLGQGWEIAGDIWRRIWTTSAIYARWMYHIPTHSVKHSSIVCPSAFTASKIRGKVDVDSSIDDPGSAGSLSTNSLGGYG